MSTRWKRIAPRRGRGRKPAARGPLPFRFRGQAPVPAESGAEPLRIGDGVEPRHAHDGLIARDERGVRPPGWRRRARLGQERRVLRARDGREPVLARRPSSPHHPSDRQTDSRTAADRKPDMRVTNGIGRVAFEAGLDQPKSF